MTAFGRDSVSPRAPRLCPECGESLVAGRCPECAPSQPARGYDQRVAQPAGGGAIDVRRARSEWVTGPDAHDPNTRRAHPTMVRAALAEAEARARDAASKRVVAATPALGERRRRTTAPRVKVVTPIGGVIESEPTVQVSAAVAIESVVEAREVSEPVSIGFEARYAVEQAIEACEAEPEPLVMEMAEPVALVAGGEPVSLVSGGDSVRPVVGVEPVALVAEGDAVAAVADGEPVAFARGVVLADGIAVTQPKDEGEGEVEGGSQIWRALGARWVWIGLGVVAAALAALASG